MKIDEVEVGGEYAYSSSDRAHLNGGAVKVVVLRVDALDRDGRMVRTPFVQRGSKKLHLPANHFRCPWAEYTAQAVRSIKRSSFADAIEQDVKDAIGFVGLDPEYAVVERVLGVPTDLVVRIPITDADALDALLASLRP